MAKILYASATGCSNIESVSISESHDNSTSIAVIECRNTSLTLGDSITVNIGYVNNHSNVFTGYVKSIERKVPNNTYTVTATDVMIRAVEYFLASSNPENPLKFRNISAESLVQNLMAIAGLTSFTYDPTGFIFGVSNEFEVNLVPVYDYCQAIARNLTWALWADYNGQVHFENRKPYVMKDEYPENQQYGWQVDTSSGYTLSEYISIDQSYAISEKNLRNRVVVYGESGIYAEAKRDISLLPSGFYKTSVLGAPGLIDSTATAQKVADYNLSLFCRFTEEIRVTVEGDPSLHARMCIDSNLPILGISGLWYVNTCDHILGKQGYTTSLGLVRMEKAT